jgi:hypothetical protein
MFFSLAFLLVFTSLLACIDHNCIRRDHSWLPAAGEAEKQSMLARSGDAKSHDAAASKARNATFVPCLEIDVTLIIRVELDQVFFERLVRK